MVGEFALTRNKMILPGKSMRHGSGSLAWRMQNEATHSGLRRIRTGTYECGQMVNCGLIPWNELQATFSLRRSPNLVRCFRYGPALQSSGIREVSIADRVNDCCGIPLLHTVTVKFLHARKSPFCEVIHYLDLFDSVIAKRTTRF